MGRRSRSRSPPTKDKKHHSKRKVSASESDREVRKEKKEKKDRKKSVDTASPAKYGIETRSMSASSSDGTFYFKRALIFSFCYCRFKKEQHDRRCNSHQRERNCKYCSKSWRFLQLSVNHFKNCGGFTKRRYCESLPRLIHDV